MKNSIVTLIFAASLFAGALASCGSAKSAEERLTPYRSTSDVRLEDITKYAASDPARAIQMIELYRDAYGAEAEDDEPALNAIWTNSVRGIKQRQAEALGKKDWVQVINNK
jgi:hypothetical protein